MQGWTRKEKIGGCLVIALLVTIVTGTGISMINLAFATSKGLKVDLEVASDYGSQNAQVDTFQDDRFISTHDQFIDQGSWIYGLQYEKGDINNGPFEVCVFLISDQIESCGNGYNSEEKKPENVFVDLTSGSVPTALEPPTENNAASAASSSSDNENTNASQSQTVVVCPAGEKCVIEQ